MDIKEAAYIAHAMTSAYSQKEKEALSIINKALDICSAPYIASSFGKDSAVLIDLVRRRAPDTEIRFIRWPETSHLGNYDEVIQAWKERGANIKILDLQRASLSEKVAGRWEMLRDMTPTDGVFIGLRSEESSARRATLSIHGSIYRYKDGYHRISPLAWWRTIDIAAYITQHDLPTLDAYKERGFSERTASRIPRESVRGDVLRRIKATDATAWAGLLQIYPDAEEWINF